MANATLGFIKQKTKKNCYFETLISFFSLVIKDPSLKFDKS